MDSSLTNLTYFPQNPFVTDETPTFPNASLPQDPSFPGWVRDTNGGITVDANNFTLVYSGLFQAPLTGTYSLCTSADNENDVYFGDGNAFSCLTGKPGTAADPLINSIGASDVNPVTCATVDLIEGAFYPLRNVMGNYQGPSAFNFTITPPGATAEQNDNAGSFYPISCGIYLGDL